MPGGVGVLDQIFYRGVPPKIQKLTHIDTNIGGRNMDPFGYQVKSDPLGYQLSFLRHLV